MEFRWVKMEGLKNQTAVEMKKIAMLTIRMDT
jgi:hypothetical protein